MFRFAVLGVVLHPTSKEAHDKRWLLQLSGTWGTSGGAAASPGSPAVSHPELPLGSWGFAAVSGGHRDRGTWKVAGPAPSKDGESIGVLLIGCDVQQVTVMLLFVPSWLANVGNQQLPQEDTY